VFTPYAVWTALDGNPHGAKVPSGVLVCLAAIASRWPLASAVGGEGPVWRPYALDEKKSVGATAERR